MLPKKMTLKFIKELADELNFDLSPHQWAKMSRLIGRLDKASFGRLEECLDFLKKNGP